MLLLSLILWIVPAALFMGMTYIEGMADGNRWDMGRIFGLAGCLVWPATLPVFVAYALWHFSRNRDMPPVLRRARQATRPTTGDPGAGERPMRAATLIPRMPSAGRLS